MTHPAQHCLVLICFPKCLCGGVQVVTGSLFMKHFQQNVSGFAQALINICLRWTESCRDFTPKYQFSNIIKSTLKLFSIKLFYKVGWTNDSGPWVSACSAVPRLFAQSLVTKQGQNSPFQWWGENPVAHIFLLTWGRNQTSKYFLVAIER